MRKGEEDTKRPFPGKGSHLWPPPACLGLKHLGLLILKKGWETPLLSLAVEEGEKWQRLLL